MHLRFIDPKHIILKAIEPQWGCPMDPTGDLWNTVLSNIIGKDSGWFWQMGEVAVLTVTLLFIYHEVKMQRYTSMFNTITGMRDTWNGAAMMQFRKDTCRNHLKGHPGVRVDFPLRPSGWRTRVGAPNQ